MAKDGAHCEAKGKNSSGDADSSWSKSSIGRDSGSETLDSHVHCIPHSRYHSSEEILMNLV